MEYSAAEEAKELQAESTLCRVIDSASGQHSVPKQLVPTRSLSQGFGQGHGDMSEALGSLHHELSESSSPAAKCIAKSIVLVPLPVVHDPWPCPRSAWEQVEDWKVAAAPLIAVDLSAGTPAQATCKELAKQWVPRQKDANAGSVADLGSSHRLVALVCYMWNLKHYVTFCRRQRDPTQCLFFNDLPELTRGAPREVLWRDVPEVCGQYLLTPRLALYETLTFRVMELGG